MMSEPTVSTLDAHNPLIQADNYTLLEPFEKSLTYNIYNFGDGILFKNGVMTVMNKDEAVAHGRIEIIAKDNSEAVNLVKSALIEKAKQHNYGEVKKFKVLLDQFEEPAIVIAQTSNHAILIAVKEQRNLIRQFEVREE